MVGSWELIRTVFIQKWDGPLFIPKINRTYLSHYASHVLPFWKFRCAGRIKLPLVIARMDQLELRTEQKIVELLVVKEAKGKIDPGLALGILKLNLLIIIIIAGQSLEKKTHFIQPLQLTDFQSLNIRVCGEL